MTGVEQRRLPLPHLLQVQSSALATSTMAVPSIAKTVFATSWYLQDRGVSSGCNIPSKARSTPRAYEVAPFPLRTTAQHSTVTSGEAGRRQGPQFDGVKITREKHGFGRARDTPQTPFRKNMVICVTRLSQPPLPGPQPELIEPGDVCCKFCNSACWRHQWRFEQCLGTLAPPSEAAVVSFAP